MTETWGDNGDTRASVLADNVNAIVGEAVLRSMVGEKVRDYFKIGVVGYSNNTVYDALAPDAEFTYSSLRGIAYLYENPRRIDQRTGLVGDSGTDEVDIVAMPVWVDPQANGNTPMALAFDTVRDVLTEWVLEYPDGYPPIVINVTDALSTGRHPRVSAENLCSVATSDGATLLFNIHIGDVDDDEVVFPDADDTVGDDEEVRALFGMSSLMPPELRDAAKTKGITVSDESRGFARGVDPGMLLAIYDIGSTPFFQAVSR